MKTTTEEGTLPAWLRPVGRAWDRFVAWFVPYRYHFIALLTLLTLALALAARV